MARVLVAGGGVGGLLAARLLKASGHDVTLVERAAAPPRIGAGLVLPTFTATLLARAGVDIGEAALPLDSLSITGPDGRRRATTKGRISVARPDLVAALLEDLSRYAEMRCSNRLLGLELTPHGVRCRTETDELEVDLLVGADGIRSAVRAQLAPRVPLRLAGQVCWRGILELDLANAPAGDHSAGHVGPAHATELWNGTERVGLVPLAGGRTYVYYVHRADADGIPATAGVTSAARSTLPAREAAAVRELLALPSDVLLRHELWELERPVWGGGAIALVGDAAHAITPNLGLGAALALSDAAALTRAMGRARVGDGADIAAAVRSFGRGRSASVRVVQLASRAVGEFAHSQHPVAVNARKAIGLQGRDGCTVT